MEKKLIFEKQGEQIENNNIKQSIYKQVLIKLIYEKDNIRIFQSVDQAYPFIQKEITPKNKEEEKRINNFFQNENPLRKEHKNILTLMYKCYQNGVFYFIFEYCEKTLAQYLEERKSTFSEKEIQSFIRQLLNGLYILTHCRKINCCILNPDNIYIEIRDDKIIPKIKYCNANYILTKSLSKENYEYLSPEGLEMNNDFYDPMNPYTLLWSLGVLIYRLFFGYTPFSQKINEKGKEDFFKCINGGDYYFSLEQDISFKLILLIKNLLLSNPHRRLSWKEIQNNLFLTQDYSSFHMIKKNQHEVINLNIFDSDKIFYYFFSEMMELKEKTVDGIKNISMIQNIKESNIFGSKIDFGD